MGAAYRCQDCGKTVTVDCVQAGNCAKGERNVRRYGVVRICKSFLRIYDRRLTVEPSGLGGRVRECRLAHVLVDLGDWWCEVPLDVGIADQEAKYAQTDCVGEIYRRKTDYSNIKEVFNVMVLLTFLWYGRPKDVPIDRPYVS